MWQQFSCIRVNSNKRMHRIVLLVLLSCHAIIKSSDLDEDLIQ